MIPTQKDYAKARLDLLMQALNVSAIAVQYLPDRLNKEIREGNGISVLNHNLKTLADSIDHLLWTYDAILRSLGLPDDDWGRYAEFFRANRERMQQIADANAQPSKPATKPKTAKSDP